MGHQSDQALTILDAKRGSSGSTVRLADWLTDHADRLLKIRSISSPVHRKYLGYIRNDINPFYGEEAAIDVVTQDTDAAWIVFLEQDKGNAPKTIKNKHGFLSSGLRAAVEQRPGPLLPFNPCAGVRLPTDYGGEKDIFDNHEWELFEELIIARWRPQAEFGLVSMARPSEVGAPLVHDVHPVTGAVRGLLDIPYCGCTATSRDPSGDSASASSPLEVLSARAPSSTGVSNLTFQPRVSQ